MPRTKKVEYVNPNSISREMFLQELDAASRKIGSDIKLGMFLKTSDRILRFWREGKGPRQKHMAELYVLLKNFNAGLVSSDI